MRCQRFGTHRNGLQRFRCPNCKKTYTEDHARLIDDMNIADEKGGSVAETITRDIFITPANPELDDTRPDHDRMYRVASEADDVFNRIGEQKTADQSISF